MKNFITHIMIVSSCLVGVLMSSCEDTFIEKPVGDELVADSVFANSTAARQAIAKAYARPATWGIEFVQFNFDYNSNGTGLLHGIMAHIANEKLVTNTWETSFIVATAGMLADRGDGNPRSPDRFYDYWQAIRICYLVIDNIDKVSDMLVSEKEQVKGEMKALIAYTYEEMFKRYGGMPIVTKTLSVEDDILLPRRSLQSMLDFTIRLCDEAAAVLPDSYSGEDHGRMTKGTALAIKAEILMYAARPLFNSETPYLPGSADSLWNFGSYQASRWQDAIDANLAVLDWAVANGVQIIDTNNPLADYGVATSTPGNQEALFVYKDQYTSYPGDGFRMYHDPHNWEPQANNPSWEALMHYRKADGTDQTWANETPAPFTEYFDKMAEMEPRLQASISRIAGDAPNNPGDQYWEAPALGAVRGFEGVGRSIKFFHNAGTRIWTEFPLYRLAENYLNLAEAYNEIDNSAQALNYLNVIRDRGGIPDETETNKALLRTSIQREWFVEFYQELHRLFDVKHWRMAPTALGGSRHSFGYTYTGGNNTLPSDFVTYFKKQQLTGFWSDNQYLTPIPIGEVNKEYIVQNPGY